MGSHPALAQSAGPLLGGHLASLKVTSWPLTQHSILAFPADRRLGSEPALARLWDPGPELQLQGYPTAPFFDFCHRSLMWPLVPQFPHLGRREGKGTKGTNACQASILCWGLLGLTFRFSNSPTLG